MIVIFELAKVFSGNNTERLTETQIHWQADSDIEDDDGQ